MQLAEELRASLQEFLEGSAVEIREAGSRILPAGTLSWEVRGAQEKPLLHLWAENCNLTRRVLAIADQSEESLALAVERFGRAKPDKMTIVRADWTPSAKQVSRADFCDQLRRILAEQFPDETLERISIAADLEHTLSRMYARGVMKRGAALFAFLAVPAGETQDAVENSLTYGLLWLDRARQSAQREKMSGLRLILPKGKAGALANRLAALHPGLAVQVFELDPARETLERVDPCSDGNVAAWLVPRREAQMLLDKAQPEIAPMLALAPEAIRAHASLQSQEVHLRFRGLTFAFWHDGIVRFETEAGWKELSKSTERAMHQRVEKLRTKRNPLSDDVRHPLYRAQPERWMQSMILEDVRTIDVSLDPEFVYEQVFARGPAEHGVIDLLGVTRLRRLALLELKAAENLNLPLQAMDYYARIRRHLAQGDFAGYGYFTDLELQKAPPLVYLVAPALRFHPSTDRVLHYLRRDIEVIRIGVAENWRRGLRVMMRH